MELKILEIDKDYKIPYVDVYDFNFSIENVKNLFTEEEDIYYTYIIVKCLDCDNLTKQTGRSDYNTMIILLGSLCDYIFDMVKNNKIYIELFSDYHIYQRDDLTHHANLILISSADKLPLDDRKYYVPYVNANASYSSIMRISSDNKNNLAKLKMLMENV